MNFIKNVIKEEVKMKNNLSVFKEVKTKFYQFNQNNTGGSFITDENLCHRLFIEAKDENEACEIAERLGVYFNGCEEGMDCPCCGDRWYRPNEVAIPYKYGAFTLEQAEKIAEKYGATVERREKKNSYKDRMWDVVFPLEMYAKYLAEEYGWTSPDVRIFYKDGTVKEIESSKVQKTKKKGAR